MSGIGPVGPVGAARIAPPRGSHVPIVVISAAIVTIAAAVAASLLLPRRPDPLEPTSPPANGLGGDAAAGALTIGQLNAYNLFDTVDDPKKQDDVPTQAEHDAHLHKLALTIRDTMDAPDVITLEEVENLAVLQELVAQPELAALGYVPVLREGRDPRGIDVAVLYRGDRFTERSVTTCDTTGTSASGRKVKDFTRPPLVVELAPTGGADGARLGVDTLTIAALHLTSRLQGADGERRRTQQAASIAGQVDALRAVDPDRLVILGGDLNMAPHEAPYRALVDGRFDEPLTRIPEADRYSYRYNKQSELLDHVLLTRVNGVTVEDARIPHINTGVSTGPVGGPAGSSDHDPVIVELGIA